MRREWQRKFLLIQIVIIVMVQNVCAQSRGSQTKSIQKIPQSQHPTVQYSVWEDIPQMIAEIENKNSEITNIKMKLKQKIQEYKQQKKWQNPTISIASEQVGWSQGWEGWTQAETEVAVTQPYLYSGIRALQKDQIMYEIKNTKMEYDLIKKKVLAEWSNSYGTIVIKQQIINYLKEIGIIVSKILADKEYQIQQGKALKYEKSQIIIEQQRLLLKVDQLRKEYYGMKRKCILLWQGQLEQQKQRVPYKVSLPKLGRLRSWLAQIPNEPHCKQLKNIYEKDQLQEKIEFRRRWPSPEVRLGVKRLHGEEATVVSGEIGFKVPIWDRNQHQIRKAQLQQQRDFQQLKSHKQSLQAKIEYIYNECNARLQKVITIESIEIPVIKENKERLERQFKEGRINRTQILAEKKKYYELKVEELENQQEYLEKWNQLRLLIGRNPYLYEIKRNDKKKDQQQVKGEKILCG